MKELNEYSVNLKVTKKPIWHLRNNFVHSQHNKNNNNMKNFKVLSKTIFVNISVPVTVGQIKLDHVYSLSIYKGLTNDKIHYDIDGVDYQNVTYMGMEVEGYKGFGKLREFHKELGIDIDNEIMKISSDKISPDELDEWINDNFKDSF